ncbi:MAG: UDP-N-acetylglucosamine 2-epimerase (hydrolyzing) [Candidatus Omnitrophica bacterium CG11_big_fil_rev_8_21_14_0_20_63_9]|nr:MAG: UDP-N-acetylglucosamine 2-epimerase (hydrolyzing) [Candidatus Omnitrophica bacterium CG11_big_fil_rev_8_21_14_0_20_63_9]
MSRRIGIVTCSRSDAGIYLPLLRAIQEDPALALDIVATGMHLSPEFGLTVRQIEEAGFTVRERVESLLSSDTPEGIGKSMGMGVVGFAQLFTRWRPDLLVVLGDRFDMYPAALAALPFRIPVAHLHGGEVTEGAIDDALRHALTKLSHLHFVSTEISARRVRQMGEEPWRVVVSGALGLDHLHTIKRLSAAQLQARYGVRLEASPLLVTFHPVTLEYEQTEWQTRELLEALAASALPVIFTMPNADTNGRVVLSLLKRFVAKHPIAQLISNLGTEGYFSVMALAAAMVGNSSSGLVEAPSFGLPVVNVGTRQQGRVRAENVIDVGYRREEILRGIQQAVQPAFRAQLRNRANPYGDGHAAQVIVKHLKEIPLDDRLIRKRFVDAAEPLADCATLRVAAALP